MEIASRRREQEVWQACDDLWALHGDLGGITGDAIRERLLDSGKSRGSPNEIYKYRKTWGLSRGINKEPVSPSASDSDPISRAVRMVHEKIHSEAQEHIEALKREFSEELQLKNGEIAQVKEDLSAVVEEFSSLQHEFSKLAQENKVLKEQLIAEIEVRKSVEKELSISKANAAQMLRSHEQIMVEFHKNQALTIEHIKGAFGVIEKSLRAHIEEMEREKKRLGQEFSEELNRVKLEKYNLDLAAKELQGRCAQLNEELLFTEQKNINHETKFKSVLDDCLKWQKNAEELNFRFANAQKQLLLNTKQCRMSEREVLKRDLLVARLRALIAYNGGMAADGTTHKRPTSRITRTPHNNKQDRTLSHPCP